MSTTPSKAIRVFIAVPIPPPAKLILAQTIDSLSAKISDGVRWVNPDGIHLTVKFLGDVDPGRTVEITQAMRMAATEVAPFQVGLSGLGTFPNQNRPRVLWAGVRGDLERLTDLQKLTEAKLTEIEFPKDSRPFNPHLTLGRVRDQVSEHSRRGIGSTVAIHQLPESEPWLVESVELIQSHLGPGGATYTTLATADLTR